MRPTPRTHNDTVAGSGGRWPAPALLEHSPAGVPLARPYPRRRTTVRRALRAFGVLLALALAFTDLTAIPLALAAAAILLAGPLPGWLARRSVPTPNPAFVTVGYAHPHTLTEHQWIRLPDGWAVQTYHARVVVPDTIGDPTPAVVQIRCSDDVTRTYRPHDRLHIVVPVDLT